MATGHDARNQELRTNHDEECRFASNDVRLSARLWLVVAILVIVVGWLIPRLWQTLEPLEMGVDHRIPYRLGNDYWHFARTCRAVRSEDSVLLIGDSVLWGHYVDTDATLSHYLNTMSTENRFQNLGIDGIHPVALAGLVRYHATAIRNRRVIINCNLLWMSSPRHDLSSDEELRFNHPALVPQFRPPIASYRAPISQRLGIVVSRSVGLFRWADHLRTAYFEGDDLATWSIQHPYSNPATHVTLELPSPDEPPSPTPDPRPWSDKGIRPVAPRWVDLDSSLQWEFFRRTLRLLQKRGNRVFVLINPLNEHMMTPQSRSEYGDRLRQVVSWHTTEAVTHYAPPALPSSAYADLSHPTSDGYAILAGYLLEQPEFEKFLLN